MIKENARWREKEKALSDKDTTVETEKKESETE